MPKIGELIDEHTKEYIEIYEHYKDNPIEGVEASNLALVDPVQNKYIWKKVYENVKAHIDADKN